MNGSTPLRQYAVHQINQRLDQLTSETARTAQSPDEAAVHDLRVGIRRFTQGLILFPDFLPKGEVKKARKQLREMMRLTAEVRNRDIAIEHLQASADEALKQRIRKERDAHAKVTAQTAVEWRDSGFGEHLRAALKLEVQ